jgi:threonyl-tRNA synthetase
MSKVNDPLLPIRHSAEHVLQRSMEILFPGIKKVMGPSIEDGFYGDFDYEKKITSEDLERIEKQMKEIIDANLPIKLRAATIEEVKKIFKDNPYKLEFIDEIEKKDEKPMVCEIGQKGDKFYDIDLCAGPHAKSTSEIKAFKLLNIAGAYWRGDEKNKMLTRIYGTAFDSKEKLEKFLQLLEETKKCDHRKIGKDLELFMQDDEVGQGLILWLPKGAFIRHKIQEFALNTYLKNEYQLVATPHIASEKLWKHSGHLDFYKDSMYGSFGIEDEKYRLKPMNCPMHVAMYRMRPRSYRELPLRWTEMGTVYRYEKSGTMHGLTRVRGFTQDDAHIICTPNQLHDELVSALKLTLYILGTFGFKDYKMSLATRDPKHKTKFIGTDEGWKMAEKALIAALAEIGYTNYVLDEGGAVFYGPKIDIKVSDSMGRGWQLSTIQFDFNLPTRFNMTYIGEDGKEHTPYMIHRALLGSLERFMGVYIEHTGGAFPVWLAPLQVKIIPIGEKHHEYAKKIEQILSEKEIRVEVDDRPDTMQSRIRDAQTQKIPYMLIVGDKELENNTVSIRLRSEENIGPKNIEEFIKKLEEKQLTKAPSLW